MPTPRDYRIEGASASLNRSITELTAILSGQPVAIKGRLRSKVYSLIEDLAEGWYRQGIRRGVEAAS